MSNGDPFDIFMAHMTAAKGFKQRINNKMDIEKPCLLPLFIEKVEKTACVHLTLDVQVGPLKLKCHKVSNIKGQPSLSNVF